MLRPVLLALAAAGLVFVLSEAVEWIWMQEAEMSTRHFWHRIREVAAAVVAAVVAGRLVFRQAPVHLTTPLASETGDFAERTGASDIAYARWFVLMRWIAVVVAAALVFVTVQVVELLPQEVWFPLMGTIAGLAVLNLLYTALLFRGADGHRMLSFQAYADLLVLTVLLHFSGGIENPLALLIIFHVIITGIVLSRRECYLFAGAASLSIVLLAGAELSGLLDHYTLQIFPHVEEHGEVAHAAHAGLFVGSYVTLLSGILFLTAVFVTSLAERLRRDEQQFEDMAARALTQQQTLERALETTGTGLCVRDRRLEPLLAKGRLQDRASRNGAEADGNEAEDGLPWPLPGADEPARRTLEDGQVRVTELSERNGRDPSARPPRTFQVTTAPLHDPSGHVAHVVQLVQDVTEQKTAQAHMLRAGQLAAVGELAGQVAHEVNNPIAIISAKARLLIADHRNDMSDKTAGELEKIIHLSDRVAHIAQGLLSYCRPTPARRERVHLSMPVRSALSMVEQRAGKSGIRIEDRLPVHLPPAHANAQELEQVFLNLFLNALDAMPGGGRLTVTADVKRTGNDDVPATLTVRIEDTGTGIPAAVRNRIFEPFFTTKPEGKGTGLGLSICHGLIKSYGGRIDIESAEGEGTRVTVNLPAAPRTEEAADG